MQCAILPGLIWVNARECVHQPSAFLSSSLWAFIFQYYQISTPLHRNTYILLLFFMSLTMICFRAIHRPYQSFSPLPVLTVRSLFLLLSALILSPLSVYSCHTARSQPIKSRPVYLEDIECLGHILTLLWATLSGLDNAALPTHHLTDILTEMKGNRHIGLWRISVLHV